MQTVCCVCDKYLLSVCAIIIGDMCISDDMTKGEDVFITGVIQLHVQGSLEAFMLNTLHQSSITQLPQLSEAGKYRMNPVLRPPRTSSEINRSFEVTLKQDYK